ncbi:MAG TPA: hypothetical protein VGH02_09845 [Rhizomicrobium sp.]|jgi:hypothetical protein
MSARSAFTAFAFVALASQAHAADSDAMAKTATGFYAVYSTFHPSDGIPDVKGRAKYAPYISDRLNGMLVQADAAEDKFASANKNTPPLVEGDLFTSNFEGATAYKIGTCTGDTKAGHCAIQLTYDPGKTANPKDKPFSWTDTVYLANSADGWKIDDIGFGGNWDFGNKGKMSDTLKMVITTAGE